MDNKIYNSSNVSVEFTPWTDSGYRITSLRLTEKLGGTIPRGELNLLFVGNEDISQDFISTQNTGTIKLVDEKDIENSLKYEFDVFITHRKFYGNYVDLEFVVTKDVEFFTKRISTYHYKSVTLKDKIKSLFPGDVDFRNTDPDVPDISIYQNCETNFELLTRLCYSYKKDSIFCFSWDGLIIKDLVGQSDHLGNKEPTIELDTYRLVQQASPYELNYDKLQNHEPFNPWKKGDENTMENDYSEFKSKYFSVQMDYQKYNVVEKDHEPYLTNALLNTKKMKYPGNTSLKVVSTDIPHYKIGDALKDVHEAKNVSLKMPWKTYVVYSNELYYSVDDNNKLDENGFKFSWTSYFYGIEESPFNKQA